MYTTYPIVQLEKDLELLRAETPGSIIPLALRIHALLDPSVLQSLRKVNFMSYEMDTLCKGASEWDRLKLLNDYFFNKQGFYIKEGVCHELWNMGHVVHLRPWNIVGGME